MRIFVIYTPHQDGDVRIGHALCIKCLKLIGKYFFLADLYFFGGRLRFG
jgi:hypothetical protein